MNDYDIAWAAGFFDGEGSIMIVGGKARKNGIRPPLLRLRVGQNSREPLDKLKEMFGGCVYLARRESARWSEHWRWGVDGPKAHRVLIELMPFLVVKRRHAESVFLARTPALLNSLRGKLTDRRVSAQAQSNP